MSRRDRNVLVTGGAGFIGSHVVDHLLHTGIGKVTVLDNFDDFYNPALKNGNVAENLNKPQYRLIRGDICDQEGLDLLLRSETFDTIIHLAARSGIRPSYTYPQLYERTNVAGTLNVLDGARTHNVTKLIFASSSSVYGVGSRPPFREDAPLAPISPYAATKAAAELLAHTYSYLYGLRIVCLRLFSVYGARQRPDLVIHKFAHQIARGEPIVVYGNGAAERDFTHIDDVWQGIWRAMQYLDQDGPGFEIINIGTSQTIAIRELISLLETALGRPALITNHPAQKGDMLLTHADVTKARKLLGYIPSRPLRDGIAEFLAWFQQSSDAVA
jgi:UDP-glucuronate 4-epimerase